MSSLKKSKKKVNGKLLGTEFNSILVVLDCAKNEHVAQFIHPQQHCHLLPRALTIANNNLGLETLLKELKKSCKAQKLKYEDVLFVIEDLPSYCRNFIHQLQQHKFRVGYVNAFKASKYNSNERSSSDILDLDRIARTTILTRIHEANKKSTVLYQQLKLTVRERERLVSEKTAHECVLHTYMDNIFPGFLDYKKSGINSFSPSCIKLMSRQDFSAASYARKKPSSLTTLLKNCKVSNYVKTAEKLHALANSSLRMNDELRANMLKRLHINLEIFTARLKAIEVEEKMIASLLVQTPGFYLTSIPGISIVMASKVMSELSDPAHWGNANRMSSYAGIIPRQKQSGGSDKAPVTLCLPSNCNHFLKNVLMSMVQLTKTHDHPSIKVTGVEHDLKKHFHKVGLRGGYSFTSTAKKLVRVMRALVFNETIYMPQKTPLPPDKIMAWIEIETERMQTKWATYGVIANENNKLGEWLNKKEDLTQILK